MKQSADNRFVEIGRIGRPHGLDGKVRFNPNDLFTADLFERLSVFYMKNRRADLIPVRLEHVQLSEKKNQQTFFVKFDMIASRDDADSAMNRALFTTRDELRELPNPIQSEEQDLTGYSVFEGNQRVGEVLDVLSNPAHPILEVKFGSSTLLIPFVDEYIVRTDDASATVYCQNLEHFTD